MSNIGSTNGNNKLIFTRPLGGQSKSAGTGAPSSGVYSKGRPYTPAQRSGSIFNARQAASARNAAIRGQNHYSGVNMRNLARTEDTHQCDSGNNTDWAGIATAVTAGIGALGGLVQAFAGIGGTQGASPVQGGAGAIRQSSVASDSAEISAMKSANTPADLAMAIDIAENKKTSLNAQLSKLQTAATTAKEQLATKKQEISQKETDIKTKESAVTQAKQNLQGARNKRDAATSALQSANSTLSAAATALSTADATLAATPEKIPGPDGNPIDNPAYQTAKQNYETAKQQYETAKENLSAAQEADSSAEQAFVKAQQGVENAQQQLDTANEALTQAKQELQQMKEDAQGYEATIKEYEDANKEVKSLESEITGQRSRLESMKRTATSQSQQLGENISNRSQKIDDSDGYSRAELRRSERNKTDASKKAEYDTQMRDWNKYESAALTLRGVQDGTIKSSIITKNDDGTFTFTGADGTKYENQTWEQAIKYFTGNNN